MDEAKKQFVMLIKVTQGVKRNPALVGWMDEIEADYMTKFGRFGLSIAHLALDGPWDFALVFPGSKESASYLGSEILRRDPDTEIQTMEGIDLDDFKARFRAAQ
jgi:hypothetical protein